MGKVFLNIMEPEDVEKIIGDLPVKKSVENVLIKEAHRRVLAEDVYATINLPPFSRASMDGYAVRSEDTFKASEDYPVKLRLLESVGAGDIPKNKVEKGTCIEISTGAPVPEGADGVVMVEVTQRKAKNNNSEEVMVYESVTMGENIAVAGSDVKKGEILLPSGALINSNKIGVLSAIGMKKVPVFAKPKVAVISTGNEIVKNDQKLEYGKIYDINSQTISNAVEECGCTPVYSEIVKDDYKSFMGKINEFKDVDLIITSGGTSAGTGDVLRTVLDELGDVLVHGIAVKPGKPTIVGLIPSENDKKVIIGLPGNPVSALVIFHVFVAPFLRKMASLKDEGGKKQTRELKISRRYHSAKGRLHYVLVKVDKETAIPILKDSGAISSLAEADGFIEIPKNVEIIQEGSYVTVMP
ncbi:MAG: molybdopterin-binding protein, partial [Methanobacterium paludis]|nr:molybdopterin-binding protein [Methanobacterium paludis]